MKWVISLIVLLFATPALATDYYVRPPSACTHNGDGTAYTCAAGAGQPGAWDGHDNITWASVAGNTLYVCGTHFEAKSDGALSNVTAAASNCTIRGDYSGDPGVILHFWQDNSTYSVQGRFDPDDWDDCSDGCPDGAGGTLTQAGTYYNNRVRNGGSINTDQYTNFGILEQYTSPTNLTILSNDGLSSSSDVDAVGEFYDLLTDDGTNYTHHVWVAPSDANNLTPDNDIRWGGDLHGVRWVFGDDDNVTYEDMTWIGNRANWESNTGDMDTVTFNDCLFLIYEFPTWKGTFSNWSFNRCEFDGADLSPKLIYILTAGAGGNPATITSMTIDSCYFHNNKNVGGDGHAFAIQNDNAGGSTVNGLTITKSKFEDVGSGITLWDNGSTNIFQNVEISYNWFKCDEDRDDNGSSDGGAIQFSTGSNDASPHSNIEVLYNIVEPPQNCGGASEIFCYGVKSAWSTAIKVYGNIVAGANTSYRFYRGTGKAGSCTADLRNNISIDPVKLHVSFDPRDDQSGAWVEDYNVYFPLTANGGNCFEYTTTEQSYANYNTAHSGDGRTTNGNSSTSNPNETSEYRIGNSSSSALNAGVDLGADYKDALRGNSRWPDSTGDSGVNTLNQGRSNNWEIGAFVYDERGAVGVGP